MSTEHTKSGDVKEARQAYNIKGKQNYRQLLEVAFAFTQMSMRDVTSHLEKTNRVSFYVALHQALATAGLPTTKKGLKELPFIKALSDLDMSPKESDRIFDKVASVFPYSYGVDYAEGNLDKPDVEVGVEQSM
jgi:hypothetical protein